MNTGVLINKYNNNTDWNDVIYREAFSQNYGISVQGGDEVASYFLALGYNGAQSVLEDNDVNRLNIRFNTDINMFKHLFIRFDASYSNVTRNLKDQGAPEGYNEGTVTSVNYLGLVKSPMLILTVRFPTWHSTIMTRIIWTRLWLRLVM